MTKFARRINSCAAKNREQCVIQHANKTSEYIEYKPSIFGSNFPESDSTLTTKTTSNWVEDDMDLFDLS